MSTRTTVSRILLLATIALLGGAARARPGPAVHRHAERHGSGCHAALLPGAEVSVIEIARTTAAQPDVRRAAALGSAESEAGHLPVVVSLDGFKKAAVDK